MLGGEHQNLSLIEKRDDFKKKYFRGADRMAETQEAYWGSAPRVGKGISVRGWVIGRSF